MSNAISIGRSHASVPRWLVAVSQRGFIGMALGLALFYKSHDLPLMVVGLLIFGIFAVLQPDIALLFVLGTVPLFIIPAEINGIRHTVVHLPLHEVTLFLVAGAVVVRWLGYHLWYETQPGWASLRQLPTDFMRWSANHITILLLVLAGILGVLWAVPEGRGAAFRELRWLIVEPLLFYILLSHAFRQPGAQGKRNQTYALAVFMLSGAVVATIGLLQFAGLDLVWLFGRKQVEVTNVVAELGLWRVNSVYGSPNNLGLYLGRVWPLSAMLLVHAWQPNPIGTRRHWWRICFFAVVTVLCLIGLVVSFSRGAWLGVGAALVVLVFPHLGWHKGRRWMFGYVALGAALIVIVGLALSLRGGLISANPLMRLSFWREALLLIRQHPLGIGLDQFFYYHNPVYGRSQLSPQELALVDPTAAHPHNLILDIWLRLGPLGIVAFAWLILRFFRQARAAAQASSSYTAWLACGALAAMTAAIVHGLVDNFYFVPDLALTFWLLVALAEAWRVAMDSR